MTITRRGLLGSVAAAGPIAGLRAQTAPSRDGMIRMGILTDLSGPYKDDDGPTSVVCAQQAIAEAIEADPSLSVSLLVADHQQKPDVGVSIVREWIDRQGVDVVVGVGNSPVAFACNTVIQERDKVHLNTAAVSSDLTGKYCSPNLVHWTMDTWCLAHSTAKSLTGAGSKKWFFIVADYAFGHVLHTEAARVVAESGGTVTGSVTYPFPGTTDFSSYLLQAQASGATVVGLANSGSDFVNCVKQAKEFRLDRAGLNVAALNCYLPDIMSIGLPVAQGLRLTEVFYWDLNDRTRHFTQRVKPKLPVGTHLCSNHAGTYSGVLHYLKVARQMGPAQAKQSGREMVAAMKLMPTDDDCFGPGRIRKDGRKIHPAYLFEVKAPSESRQPGDAYKHVATVPIEEAFRPENDGGCSLVRG